MKKLTSGRSFRWKEGMLGYFGKLTEKSKLFIVEKVGLSNVKIKYLNSNTKSSKMIKQCNINATLLDENKDNWILKDGVVYGAVYEFKEANYVKEEEGWVFTFMAFDGSTATRKLGHETCAYDVNPHVVDVSDRAMYCAGMKVHPIRNNTPALDGILGVTHRNSKKTVKKKKTSNLNKLLGEE